MSNYRGGSGQMSPFAAEAIRRINNGETEWQRAREFRQKATMAGVQATLGVIGHGLEAEHSMNLQKENRRNQRNEDTMRGAIASQTRESRAQDRTRAESQQYASADSVEANSKTGAPAWLTASQAGEKGMDLSLLTDQAKQNQVLNSSAAMAPVGGVYTPGGMENMAGNADGMSNDIRTGKELMSQAGGMQKSLLRAPQ